MLGYMKKNFADVIRATDLKIGKLSLIFGLDQCNHKVMAENFPRVGSEGGQKGQKMDAAEGEIKEISSVSWVHCIAVGSHLDQRKASGSYSQQGNGTSVLQL